MFLHIHEHMRKRGHGIPVAQLNSSCFSTNRPTMPDMLQPMDLRIKTGADLLPKSSGKNKLLTLLSLHIERLIRHKPHINTASNCSSIVTCVFVAAETCLPSCCLAAAVPFGSTIPVFGRGWDTATRTARWCHNPHFIFFFRINKIVYKIMN